MDETALRLLPPLRAAWAPKGEQTAIPISGRNAQGSLYCALNLQSGKRITVARSRQRQADFHVFLRRLRQGGGARGALLLLLDSHSSHTARASIKLAQDLGITLLWLPTQCPSLNPVDHLWRGLKANISANRQFANIDEQVRFAQMWIHRRGAQEALRKSGMLSDNFWLHSVCKNFRDPT